MLLRRQPPDAGAHRSEFTFGVTVEQLALSGAAQRSALQRLRATGVQWVRQRFDWGLLEPAPGVFDWTAADRWFTGVAASGLAPMAVLDGSPAWARAPQDQLPPAVSTAPPADVADFARLAGAFAARYGPQLRYYQIWDEPNIAPHWGRRPIEPVAYARLLRAAAAAIRQADGDSYLLAAALAPTVDRGHLAIDEGWFLQRLIAAGGLAVVDAVAVQPFGFGDAPAAQSNAQRLNFRRAEEVRRTLVDTGLGELPIWAVRFGWNRAPISPWQRVTPATQARFAAEAVALARSQWPWLAGLGWAVDAPAAPAADPQWGFALAGAEGEPLSAALAEALAAPISEPPPAASPWAIGAGLAGLLLMSGVVITRRGRAAARLVDWRAAQTAYAQWPLAGKGMLWAAALLFYYFAAAPPLILVALLLLSLLFWWEPRTLLPLLLAAIPFHLWHKELHFAAGAVTLPPVYALLLCGVPLLWCEGKRLGRAGALWVQLRPLYLPAGLVALSLLAMGQVWQWPAYGRGLWELAVGPFCLAAALLLLGPPHRLLTLGWALAGGGLLVALGGLAGWLQGAGGLVDGVTRLVGPHFSPNHTALYLLRSFWLSVALIWLLPPRWRWAGVSVAALQGIALLLTGSRGALVMGVPAGALLLLWLILLRRPAVGWWLRRRWPWAVGSGLLLGVAVVLWLTMNWQRLANVQTLWLRLDLWQATLALVQDAWRTGVGPGGFFWRYPAYLTGSFPPEPNQLHPHNVWLEWLVTWGVGGLVWLAAAIALLVKAGAPPVTARREQFWLLGGLAVAWCAALAHGQSDAFHLLPDLAAWNGAAWGLWWLGVGRQRQLPGSG